MSHFVVKAKFLKKTTIFAFRRAVSSNILLEKAIFRPKKSHK